MKPKKKLQQQHRNIKLQPHNIIVAHRKSSMRHENCSAQIILQETAYTRASALPSYVIVVALVVFVAFVNEFYRKKKKTRKKQKMR